MTEYDDFPGIVTDSESGDDPTLIETAYSEMMAVEMMAREKEIFAAWRAGYDFLYVLSSFNHTDLSLNFIPSNDPDLGFEGVQTERYDLREENLPPRAREILMKFKP